MRKFLETDTEIFFLKEPDANIVTKIQSHFNLSELTSRIIANRGYHSIKDVSFFLTPTLRNLPDPFLFNDMRRAVERILKAITEKESILIYGDFDTDGITSTALLVNFFKEIRFPVRYFIPNRFQDGYGLNLRRLKKLYKASSFSLLITVDCGSSSESVIKELSRSGIDVIITDHHQTNELSPSAFGTINPSSPECSFPYRELSGVGVAFFLLIALRSCLRDARFWTKNGIAEIDLRKFLDLVCIGTIADMVPMKNVNRILVNTGLSILPRTENPGLKYFLKNLGLLQKRGSISPWEVAFQVAPRLNAAGRLEDATICVRLLTTHNENEASWITKKLETLNTQRQRIENELLSMAEKKIVDGTGFFSPHAIVLWGEHWHEGVIGIGASKLVEKFGRPVILISLQGESGKGSLRGIEGTDIFKAMCHCDRWLDSFGGHPMAGGLKIHREHILDFSREFSNAIKIQLSGETPKKLWEIDALIVRKGIPRTFFSELAKLEPFGIKNPPPLLALTGFNIRNKQILKGKHIRLNLEVKGSHEYLQGIAFNAAEHWERLDKLSGIIGVPTLNFWNGNVSPQINIKRFLYQFF